MSIYFRQIQHLLPRTKTWSLPFGSTVRKFFEGLADGLSEPARDFIDGVWAEIFPETTTELVEWEQELGCWGGGTEAQRRLSLAAEWQATGGQAPRYLQDIIQAAGFDVYYHGWWDPVGEEVRDPHDYTESANSGTEQCHGTKDSVQDQCADVDTDDPPRCDFFLANKIYYIVNESLNRMAPPPLPDDEDLYRNFIYYGGETFGTYALVPEERLIELKRLMLKISPANMWIVSLVTSGPAAFGSLVAWWDLGAEPYEKLYKDGAGQQLLNPGFESGDPPDDWTSISGGVLTRDTGTPYEGSACMRATIPVADTLAGARQVGATVVGATYYWSGQSAGDGANGSGAFLDGGTGLSTTTTTNAAWQALNVVYQAAATDPRIYCMGDVATEDYARFDDLSMIECPGRTTDRNLVNLSTHALTQTGGAGIQSVYAPNWGEAGGLYVAQFDGTDDYAIADSVAGAVFSGTDQPFTIGFSFQLLDTSGTTYVWTSGSSGASNPKVQMYCTSGTLYLYRKDDTGEAGAGAVNMGSTDTDRHDCVVTFTGTVWNAWIDGVQVVTNQTRDVGTLTLDRFTVGAAGGPTVAGFANCVLRDVTVYDEDIGASNATALSAWLQSRSPLS